MNYECRIYTPLEPVAQTMKPCPRKARAVDEITDRLDAKAFIEERIPAAPVRTPGVVIRRREPRGNA